MDIFSLMMSPLRDGYAVVGSTETEAGTVLLAVTPAGEGRFWVTVGVPTTGHGTVWRGPTTAVPRSMVASVVAQCAPGTDWSQARWSAEPCPPKAEPGPFWHADPRALADFWKAIAKLLNGDERLRVASAA